MSKQLQNANTATLEKGTSRISKFGNSSTRGQALIETVLALVALMAVFAALVQLSLLGQARTKAMKVMAGAAGAVAVNAAVVGIVAASLKAIGAETGA